MKVRFRPRCTGSRSRPQPRCSLRTEACSPDPSRRAPRCSKRGRGRPSSWPAKGAVGVDDPVKLFVDSRPVATKLRKANPRGTYREVWEAMLAAAEAARAAANRADSLAVPHEDPSTWRAEPSEETVRRRTAHRPRPSSRSSSSSSTGP